LSLLKLITVVPVLVGANVLLPFVATPPPPCSVQLRVNPVTLFKFFGLFAQVRVTEPRGALLFTELLLPCVEVNATGAYALPFHRLPLAAAVSPLSVCAVTVKAVTPAAKTPVVAVQIDVTGSQVAATLTPLIE